MPPHLPAPVPELPVADLAAAADHYRRCLGFAIDVDGDVFRVFHDFATPAREAGEATQHEGGDPRERGSGGAG